MPMPVANIIDTQENLENSGTESSGPNLMLPYLLRARYAENSTNAALVRMNSQPNDPVTQDMALPVRSSIFFGAITPQTTKATARAAATAKTTRSTGGPFRDFTSPSEASSVDSDTVLVIGPPSSGGLRTSVDVDVDVAHRTPSRAMRNSSCPVCWATNTDESRPERTFAAIPGHSRIPAVRRSDTECFVAPTAYDRRAATGWATWPNPISRQTSPCSTCPARHLRRTPTPTCRQRSRGTSAPTPGRRSGCKPPRAWTSTR